MKCTAVFLVLACGCDSAVLGDDDGNQTSPLSMVNGDDDVTWTPAVVTVPDADNQCTFRDRMEALMRNLSTCWHRDSYIMMFMRAMCPMDGLVKDIDKKLLTLRTCYGLEYMESDGSMWYRWPSEEARQHAIDVVVSLDPHPEN